MASNVWWCVISLTWFLAAGLKWGSESIAQYRAHFHLFAWTLPLVQTLAVLSQSLVDADPLTGICGVGNTQLAALRLYSLIPTSAYLLVGITFLGAGFVALFNIRRSLIRNQRNQTQRRRRRSQKLEKLMIRIGVFSILFTVPATCVIACQYYESLYRKEWERTLVCRTSHSSGFLNDECAKHEPHKPEFWVFILKYFMSMVIGVTSGFWIWSAKSLNSWRVFFGKFCPSAAPSPTPSKLTPNSSECTEEIDRSICCLSFKEFFCCNKEIRRKDSMVYFQARDDMKPPNNLYDLPHSIVPVVVAAAAPAFPQPQPQPYANFSDDDFGPVFLKSGSSSGQFYASNWANLVVSGVGIHNQQQQMQQQQQQLHQHLAMASQGTIYEFPSSTKLPTSATTTTNLTSSSTAGSSLPSTISTIRR